MIRSPPPFDKVQEWASLLERETPHVGPQGAESARIKYLGNPRLQSQLPWQNYSENLGKLLAVFASFWRIFWKNNHRDLHLMGQDIRTG